MKTEEKQNTGFLKIACCGSEVSCHKNVYCHQSSFDDLYHLIMEHAKDLYSPKSLLDDILNKLEHTQIIEYTINDLKEFSNKMVNKKFNEAINSNQIKNTYKLYVMYFDPINEEFMLPFNDNHQIKNKFMINSKSRAESFFNNNIFIIIVNSNTVNRFDRNLVELEIDHELNHLFGKYEDNQGDDISMDENIRNNGYSYDIKISDFSKHMFDEEEFISMISNVCNCLSLMFNEKDELMIFDKYMKILTTEFINSNEFLNLNEPIKGAILFSYICKKYVPNRWNFLFNKVKIQLNLTGIKGSFKIFLFKLKNLFKNSRIIK